ncbi:peptidyl-prolyl cis-trans isomerase, rhodopsin-specific isozyme-like [Agrilus planipennis]|uniref:Peptidyl-prolyl cis-trans isomerase n=1 Tax=Agrilus planipennis TaxID=224129 RepID=A0A1W4X0L7_AGRPL|nr:peptidyl-prolyl cis-trans isomerase, rhodopsin-specific isozyme-like [Agrilus planipennis]
MNTVHLFGVLLLFIQYVKAGEYKVTDQVYFDIKNDEKKLGRIVIGLFGDIAPKTVENFKVIATEGINGKSYAGTKFFKVIQKFIIQGGDIIHNNGSGSISIYGSYYPDENFDLSHRSAGFVSMANTGPNTNGCQFFITTVPTTWLDGKYTVFGKVIQGQEIVHIIEHSKTDPDDKPLKPAIIFASGIIPTPEPFLIYDFSYGVLEWLKAGFVPLSFSFTILAFFHWAIRKLDSFKYIHM